MEARLRAAAAAVVAAANLAEERVDFGQGAPPRLARVRSRRPVAHADGFERGHQHLARADRGREEQRRLAPLVARKRRRAERHQRA
eukprot:4100755-Prymnesium_polylepis.1